MVSQSILGLWLFTSLIYQGATMPPPNPNLKISYEFFDTGINVLHYHREGESGFCERRAAYKFSGQNLSQRVVWVNPKNAIWCDSDTDMKIGHESWSDAWIKDDHFYLRVPMGDESLIYVWEHAY